MDYKEKIRSKFDYTDFSGDIGGFVYCLKDDWTPEEIIQIIETQVIAPLQEKHQKEIKEVIDAAYEQGVNDTIKWERESDNGVAKAVNSALTELLESAKALKVPIDWNQGTKTEKRYEEIINIKGSMIDIYNQAIDDFQSLIKSKLT